MNMFLMLLCVILVICQSTLTTVLTNVNDCPYDNTLELLYNTQSELNLTKMELADTKQHLKRAKIKRRKLAKTHWIYEPCNQTGAIPVADGLADYSNLGESYYAIERAEVEFSAYRLRSQGDELWLTTAKRLYIYSPSLALKRSIPLKRVEKAMSLVPTPSGQLVVADNNEFDEGKPGGLHVLNAGGSHNLTLETGRFSDVVIYNHTIFALRTEIYNATVYIYSEVKLGVWQKMIWFALDAYSGYQEWRGYHMLSGHRMAIFNGSLYVSDAYNAFLLYQYDMTGGLLRRFDVTKGWSILLCSTDQLGNMLIADKSRNKLIVHNNTGTYRPVKLVKYKLPTYDAVVSATGETIWVLQWNPHVSKSYIIKYMQI